MIFQAKKVKVAFVFIFLLIVCLVWSLPHWCWPVSANIVYNAKPSIYSRVYRMSNGEFLLRLREEKERLYLISAKDKKVFRPNHSNFSFALPLPFVHHLDQGGVDLEYTAKTDLNPKIVARDNSIEFTGFDQDRIRVAW